MANFQGLMIALVREYLLNLDSGLISELGIWR